MKIILSILLLFFWHVLLAQQPQKSVSESIIKRSTSIKEELVNLAIQNSDVEADEANIRIAEYNLKKTQVSWLDAINASANINEFVVKNSPAAVYYPKYNLGIALPLGAYAKRKNDIKIGKEVVTISKVQKNEKLKLIKTNVLTRYENYLEKKDNLQLQIESVQELLTTYLKAQKEYASASVTLEALNSASVEYNRELAKQRTAERDANVAYIELEELVGFRLKDVLVRYGIVNN